METEVVTAPPATVSPEIKTTAGKAQAIWGIVCAVISILFFPPVFGIAGIVLGATAVKKGQTVLGITAVALSAVCMIIGMIFGAYLKLHSQM